MHLDLADVERARAAALREQRRAEEALAMASRMVRTGGVVGLAGGIGLAHGRGLDLTAGTGIPLDFVAGVAAHVVGHMECGCRHGVWHTVGDGLLAGWAARSAFAYGQTLRALSGVFQQ